MHRYSRFEVGVQNRIAPLFDLGLIGLPNSCSINAKLNTNETSSSLSGVPIR